MAAQPDRVGLFRDRVLLHEERIERKERLTNLQLGPLEIQLHGGSACNLTVDEDVIHRPFGSIIVNEAFGFVMKLAQREGQSVCKTAENDLISKGVALSDGAFERKPYFVLIEQAIELIRS